MIMVFVMFLLVILVRIFNKNLTNPSMLMCGLWFLILLLYELDIIPLSKIHSYTYKVIFIGIISFIIGTVISNHTRVVISQVHRETAEYIYYPKYKMILILTIFACVFQLPDTINSVKILMSGGDFVVLRSMSSDSVIQNSLLRAFQNYILSPFIIFLYPMAAYCLLTLKNDLRNRSCKIWIFILACITSVLQMFTSGGRASVVYLLIHIIVIMSMLNKKLYIPKVIKQLVLFLFIAVVVGVYYVSVSRGIDDVLESMVIYFNGCVPLLDYYLTEIVTEQSYTYGGAFFFAPIQLFFTLLGNLGMSEPQFLTELTHVLNVEEIVLVGSNIKMNAFVSWFFYLFKDGGYFALALEALIYGALCQAFYKNAIYDNNNIRKVIEYSIIANTIVFSMVRYQFISYFYLLAFVFTFLLIKRSIVKQEA